MNTVQRIAKNTSVSVIMYRLIQKLKDPLYKNSMFLMLSTFVGSALGFVYWIVAARLYSVEAVGIATALISAMNLIAALSKLGFDIGLVKFLPNGDRKIDMINSCLTITFVSSIVFSTIFVLGTEVWSPALGFLKKNAALFALFVVFVTVTAMIQTQYNVFVAFRKAEFSFAQNTTWFVLKLIFIVFLTSFGAFGIFISWGAAVFFGLLLSLFFLTPKVCSGYLPIPSVEKRIVRNMFYFSFGNYIASIFSIAPQMLLPLLIVNVLGAEMTAYFFIAWSISNILFIISNAVSMSLFAEGSYNQNKLRKDTIKAIKFTFLLLIPAIIGVVLFSDKLLLLFGKAYSENAVDLLRILAVSSILVAVNTLYVGVKRVQMDIKTITFIYVFIMGFTIVVSYALITKIGLIGVGIGWMLGHGIIFTIINTSLMKNYITMIGDV